MKKKKRSPRTRRKSTGPCREAATSRHRKSRGHESRRGAASSGHRKYLRLVSQVPEPPRAKRRGAQPGNHNAYKHGFYSLLFKERQRKWLDEIPLTDLSPEIELIRVTSTRFLEALAKSKGVLDYETNLTALRAVNLGAQSIATLLRIQAIAALANRDAAELLDAPDPPPDGAPDPGA
jgi:hypothetical protein